MKLTNTKKVRHCDTIFTCQTGPEIVQNSLSGGQFCNINKKSTKYIHLSFDSVIPKEITETKKV